MEDDHPLAQLLNLAEQMRGEDHRVGSPQLTDQGANLYHLPGIKAYGGFVQDDDGRIAAQRLGYTDALPVALGQVAD